MADTQRVTCAECHKRSEIMTPAPDHQGPVVWKCPQQLESGELCGQVNELAG